MSLKSLPIVTILLITFQLSQAQRNFDQYNHIGISGGFTFFDIITDNFETEQGTGFIVSFETRGAFYNDFDLIYGLNFLQTEVGISSTNLTDPTSNFRGQFVDYSILAAQLKFLLSYNIINNHLSIEAGPLLNVNGKLTLQDDRFENFSIDGFDSLSATDIEDISKINARVAAGVTAGLTNFRLSAQYQYGLTNTLKNLNDLEDINVGNTDFKGNSSTIILAVQIYF